MKRVKTVRSGWRVASATATGKTLSIQGVGQGPSAEKIRCISTQRWTLRPVRGRGNSWSPMLPSAFYSHRRTCHASFATVSHDTTARASAETGECTIIS